MRSQFDALLNPRSVALVGASANPVKIGHIALKNLSKGKFKVYPVNPKEKRILGLKCYPSVADIPGDVDLAVVSLPAEASIEPVKDCARKGVCFVIVTASGFRESGPKGAKLEAGLVEALEGSRTRLLGPNTMGVLVPSSGLDTLFIPREKSKRPKAGAIAMISQSGAVSVSFLEKAEASGIGISACVGLGNKANVDENEMLRYFASNASTKCIALYLESFTDGRDFVKVSRGVTMEKPIVLLKGGRSKAGLRAASSHTGAISSASDTLIDGALAQAGVVRAYDEEELIDVAKALAYIDQIKGDRICVVASAGGFGVIASDLVESYEHGAGLRMASLSGKTMKGLQEIVPWYSSVKNPVDLTSSVTDEMYDAVLEILQADQGVDGIMMSLELQPPNITKRLIEIGSNRSLHGNTPIVISAFGGERTQAMLREFEKRGVPAYPTIWRAIRALGALAKRGSYLRRSK